MNLVNLRNAAVALLALTTLAFVAQKTANAQSPVYRSGPVYSTGPIYRVGPVYGGGTSFSINPGRFAPGANISVPGSTRYWNNPYTGQYGRTYIGMDGRPHGFTYTPTPWGGHVHVQRVRR